jgi:hypothetical protein
MSAAYVEFARGLELVCRHLNPPFWPLPTTIRLADLDLDDAQLKGDDPRIAYRYIRGLEMPGVDPSPLLTKPIWAAERGLSVAPLAAAEIEFGMVATGDAYGVVRVFGRAGRGRWECLAALLSHRAPVRDICALDGGGFASVGDDGEIVLHRRNERGEWQLSFPARMNAAPNVHFSLAPIALHAICQLADGTVIVGGKGGVMAELTMLPSGDWEALQSTFPGSSSDILALAPFGQNRFCSVGPGEVRFNLRTARASTASMPSYGPYGVVTDVTSWRGGVLACTEAGEIVQFEFSVDNGIEQVTPTAERVATVPIRRIVALDAERVVTWSVDQQMRVWAFDSGRFVLRAALPARSVDPCVAPLCDGRVVYADTRGFMAALPQLDGTWRNEETVSSHDLGVIMVAPLSSNRVAYLEGESLRVLTLSSTEPIVAADVPLRNVNLTAMVGCDANTFVIGSATGRLYVARETAGSWTVHDLSSAHSTTVEHLAAAGPHLVSADFGGNVAIWHFENGQLQLKNTLALGRMRALAIDEDRRFAGASVDARIFVTQAHSDDYSDLLPDQFLPATPPIGLAWDEGSLLILSEDCEVRRVSFEPNPQVVFERPVLPLGQPPSFAVVTTQHGNDIAFAQGSSSIEVGNNWLAFYAHRSEIRALAAAGASLFAASETLYWFDLSPATPVIHRIVVTDHAIVEARLAWFGGVRSASIRRRDAAPWIATTLGGRAVPNDPLLHMHLAVIESSGQLGEVFSSTNFFFSPDLRELRIEDPTIPPE